MPLQYIFNVLALFLTTNVCILLHFFTTYAYVFCLQRESNRTVSTSESVASTMTAPSEEELTSSDEDNGEDNGDTSDTASAPSPTPFSKPNGKRYFTLYTIFIIYGWWIPTRFFQPFGGKNKLNKSLLVWWCLPKNELQNFLFS